ncbi:hypothetical protein C8R47DRAFT_1087282 [Mycena vitilis]|nr:hypothetical protein C8R47DRAFT_1087282 [Mycena vitilis]
MSPSAIAHVVAFLTRPLVSSFAPETISSAQVILTASLASTSSATITLNATSTPPTPLLAASIGAGIPWTAWLAALGAVKDDILLSYGPGYVKVRRGGAPVTDIWSDRQGSAALILHTQVHTKAGPSPLFQQNTSARLRAVLLSARVRSIRREQGAVPCPTSDSDDSESECASDSDSTSDSDSVSSTCSRFTSYSSDSLTSAGSAPATPAQVAAALPVAVGAYRPPFRRAQVAAKPRPSASVPVDRSKKDTTAYLYQGGVTRVMTGGVMLGPRRTI